MSRLLSRLASLRLTLGLLLTLAALAAAGTFLPQNLDTAVFRARYPEWGPLLLALGLDRFYAGPVFRGLLLLFTVNLLACATGRSREGWRHARGMGRPSVRAPSGGAGWADTLRARGFRVRQAEPLRASRRLWAFLGFPLVHLAPPLVMAGGLWGSLGGFVGTQNVHVGGLTPTVYDWNQERDRRLPFVLAVEDFQLLHYPAELQVQILDGGAPRTVEVRVGGTVIVDGSPYRVRVADFHPSTGDLTYWVGGPHGDAGPFFRNQEEGAPLRVRPLAFRDPQVRRVEARVSLRDERGQAVARQVVAINEPLVHGGLRIYLTAWGADDDGRPFTGFQVVRDPGQPLVWTGSLAFSLGLLLLLFGDGAWVREEAGELLCRASRGAARARALLTPPGGSDHPTQGRS